MCYYNPDELFNEPAKLEEKLNSNRWKDWYIDKRCIEMKKRNASMNEMITKFVEAKRQQEREENWLRFIAFCLFLLIFSLTFMSR